ncbi:MAG: hypothetical protein HOW73_37135 [Polyangiaceae bacterium]|nr:hypothetical protein [Polyangiaceae bacterium]
MTALRGIRCFVAALVLATCTFALDVQANPNAAKEAYDRAADAFARKSYSEAAASFALADRLEPNPIALEAAFKAVLLADDPVLGMELVERAGSRPANPKIDSYVVQAKAAFETRAGKLSVTCADERGCTVKLNGVDLELGKRHWVRAGAQQLAVTVDGATKPYSIDVKPRASVDFTAPAPPRSPSAAHGDAATETNEAGPRVEDKPSRGLHPAIFGVTAGLFAIAGGVTIWSGVDTLDLHDRYETGDDGARDAGVAAQDRTNILIGVVAGGAVATTIVAIFTDWGGKDAEASSPTAVRFAPPFGIRF